MWLLALGVAPGLVATSTAVLVLPGALLRGRCAALPHPLRARAVEIRSDGTLRLESLAGHATEWTLVDWSSLGALLVLHLRDGPAHGATAVAPDAVTPADRRRLRLALRGLSPG